MSSPIVPYILCAIVALSLALGQFLFKMAATVWKTQAEAGGGVLSILSPPFFAALALYAGATLLWIYVLRFIPLSRGYLFVLGGATLVPLLAHLVFKEPLSPVYWIGFAFVLAGIYLCSI